MNNTLLKTLKLLTSMALVLSILLLPACGSQPDPEPQHRRGIEAPQLYDEASGHFLLGGFHPGATRQELEAGSGFPEGEPVVLLGWPAKVAYHFEGDRLAGISYALELDKIKNSPWAETSEDIFGKLQEAFGWMVSWQSGVPGESGIYDCAWYCGDMGGMSMLALHGMPETDSTPADITLTVSADFGSIRPATTAYQAHFKPAPEEMVLVSDWIPSVYVELKYATSDNFTGQIIYDFVDAYLRYGTVEKLARVQEKLNELGYSLKIYDAFRPVSAQFKLWEVVPDSTYVANPYNGYSSHSRGNTVDVTLVTMDGEALEMPSPFDTFSPLADHDYRDVSDEAAGNARMLEDAMRSEGFRTNPYEWWHYYDKVSYPVAKDFVIGN